MVNEQDKSSIASQYLNNQKRNKRKICQQEMQHVQSVGAKITRSKKLIIKSSFYICIACNRCLHKRSVIQFHEDQCEHSVSDMCTRVMMRKNTLQNICQKNKNKAYSMPIY